MVKLCRVEDLRADPKVLQVIPRLPRPKGNPGRKNPPVYRSVVSAFDIETTTLPEIRQNFMYLWSWAIGPKLCVLGRSWEEFLDLAKLLAELCSDNEWWIIYVFNLSYEFQYLSGIYKFSEKDVFAVDSRKVAKCQMYGHLEFRDAYLHSNMSLKEFCKTWGSSHQKLSGEEFDYSKIRYPWTELTYNELKYSIHDVIGLVEALESEMATDKDSLYTIPMTSTGYVRRVMRKAMSTYNRDALKRQLPDWDLYCLLREAFRGGNVHANRFYAGCLVRKVHGVDISSSYPTQQCTKLFPMGRWQWEGSISWDRVIELMTKRRKAMLLRLRFFNIRLTDETWGCPYLTTAKSRNWRLRNPETGEKETVCDNGRILASRMLETTITDVDLQIIMAEYTWDAVEVLTVAHSTYGRLPDQFTWQVKYLYRKKTELKGKAGAEKQYARSKAMVNSIYGMTVQDPVKQTVLFHDEYIGSVNDLFLPDVTQTPRELLEASNKKAWMSYAWGIWTTSWARLQLEEAIRMAHKAIPGGGFVYCDTDSVYYVGKVDWRAYNSRKIRDAVAVDAWANDKKGKPHYMGVFEMDDPRGYPEFKTWGAKKYAYRDADGKLHLTLAGVNKKLGAEELEQAGGLDAFEDGFTFRKAGGTQSVYNDFPEITEVVREGHVLPITRNIVIEDSTYTLGETYEYMRLLTDPNCWLKMFIQDELSPDGATTAPAGYYS